MRIKTLMWVFRVFIIYSLLLIIVHHYEFCLYYTESKEYQHFIKNIKHCPQVLEVDISKLNEWSDLLHLADKFDRNSTLNTDEIFVLLWIYTYAHGKEIELPVTPEWELFEGIVEPPQTKYISYHIPGILLFLLWLFGEFVFRRTLDELAEYDKKREKIKHIMNVISSGLKEEWNKWMREEGDEA